MAINPPTTTGETLTSAYVNNMPRGAISSTFNTTATLTVNSTTETELFQAPAFTPVAGRLYRVTYSIGYIAKTNGGGNIDIALKKNSSAGTLLNLSFYSALGVDVYVPYSTSVLLTSTQMGTSSFVPVITLVANTSGFIAANTSSNNGSIIIEDIGAA